MYKIKMSEHKFIENIRLLSVSKKLAEIPKEWEFYKYREYDSKIGLCICNHRLQNVYYYINILNGNIIQVGTVCSKKYIDLDVVQKRDIKYIRGILNGNESKYDNILDIISYEYEVRKSIMEEINKDIRRERSIVELDNIYDELMQLLSIIDNSSDFGVFLEDKLREIVEKKNCILDEERVRKEAILLDEERVRKEAILLDEIRIENERKVNIVNIEKEKISYEIKRLDDTILRILAMSDVKRAEGLLTDDVSKRISKDIKTLEKLIKKYKAKLIKLSE